MEEFQSVGIGVLLLVALICLIWTHMEWKARKPLVPKAGGYRFEIIVIKGKLTDEEEEILMDIEVEFCDALGLGMGGNPYHFASVGMTDEQATGLENIIKLYFESLALPVRVDVYELRDEE